MLDSLLLELVLRRLLELSSALLRLSSLIAALFSFLFCFLSNLINFLAATSFSQGIGMAKKRRVLNLAFKMRVASQAKRC